MKLLVLRAILPLAFLASAVEAFMAAVKPETSRSSAVGSTALQAAEKKSPSQPPLVVDVYWSMRSPYCYIALDRLLKLRQDYADSVDVRFRPVYPIAIRDSSYFTGVTEYMYYRIPYQDIDTQRSAHFQNIPYRYPRPDPVLQEPNFGPIKPFEEQVLIQKLTRTAVAAADQGLGWEYLNQVSRVMWNGMVNGWDQGSHLSNAMDRAGLDGEKLLVEVMEKNPKKYDAMIEANQEAQKENLAQHTGVPLMVLNEECFFGQDRIDQLIWRLEQYGARKSGETE